MRNCIVCLYKQCGAKCTTLIDVNYLTLDLIVLPASLTELTALVAEVFAFDTFSAAVVTFDVAEVDVSEPRLVTFEIPLFTPSFTEPATFETPLPTVLAALETPLPTVLAALDTPSFTEPATFEIPLPTLEAISDAVEQAANVAATATAERSFTNFIKFPYVS